LINKILDAVPNTINITNTSLYAELGFAGNVTSTERGYLELPLFIDLQSNVTPYEFNNTAIFPNISNKGFEIEAAISQYFIDNLLY